jgi:bifunctional DNA-binding transcriptional regulator/antitoxin component of YhaV-PrlF toxin-antitoxin module
VKGSPFDRKEQEPDREVILAESSKISEEKNGLSADLSRGCVRIMEEAMKSSVTKRGQTVIPAAIRKKYGIDENVVLEWIDTGQVVKVVPVPKDAIQALRGIGKGEGLVRKLIEERRRDGQQKE